MLPLKPDDSFGRIRRAGEDGDKERDRSLADTVDEIQPDALTEYVSHPTVDVRLSGQDSERGTFNQRHAVIYDQTTALPYTPLNDMQLGPQVPPKPLPSLALPLPLLLSEAPAPVAVPAS